MKNNNQKNKEQLLHLKVMKEISESCSELSELFYILSGLELVGMENYSFWLKFVKLLTSQNEFGLIESAVLYMKQISRKKRLEIIAQDKFNEKSELSFKEACSFVDSIRSYVLEDETEEFQELLEITKNHGRK